MANKELITCDYAGCTNPFAYRVKGFNLCPKHLFDEDQDVWKQWCRDRIAERRNARGNHGS